ncbi:MAG: terpene cyclase/mutase family protein [Verrucomicrobiota bacterium]|nr:terpene cyclase/mutase family protein [Verrucomicrobiota bacterium]
MNRRTALKVVTLAGLTAGVSPRLLGQAPAAPLDWRAALLNHLATLARADGGYAWPNQPESHLTATFAVIGCHRLLGRDLPRARAAAEFIRTHHPLRAKRRERELRMFEFQQIQSLLWLGEKVSSFREPVRTWTAPLVYPARYEQHGYPVFQMELTAFTSRRLLGLPTDDLAPHFVEYLDRRRRSNGSFNNTPAADGSDGHVMNTWWGLQALDVLGRSAEKRDETVAWLRACQLAGGGFTHQPNAPMAAIDDVAYTWAAVRGLAQLGAAPADRAACLQYLHSLRNADGGFGDRAGWESNPMAAYYAAGALQALGALEEEPPASIARAPGGPGRVALLKELGVFTIQIEAHGKGSPAEAVDLSRALRIHLWGAKNASPGWIERAQSLAGAQKVPVRFFVANEEYGTFVSVPGLGTYSHTSDIIAPAGVDFGRSLADKGPVTWAQFRQQRLAPLQKAGGRLIWQFGENEELTRLYLDDSLQRGGYAAISTFHFGNPDFTQSQPFLQRYRRRLPFIALQDAHGNEPWWFADMTTGFRTVFLATEPTWEGWLEALQRNRVVAIRHDAVSGFKTWMHGGADEVIERVREQESAWRWWDNPPIERPLVSIVAVTPGDEFEAARPERGVNLRIRCQWENTSQGLPKKPVAELLEVSLDGKRVTVELVEKKQNAGILADHYHLIRLPDLGAGKHSVRATVRVLETKRESSRTLEFTV